MTLDKPCFPRMRSPWGVIGVALSLLYTDVWSFLGVRQAWRYLQGAAEPNPPVNFTSSGPYALVRHPLYFFSLLFIWVSPLMTVNGLLFNLLTTLYLWLGSLHEERRLEAAYVQQYRRYQAEVPALLPLSLLRKREAL